MVVSARSAFIEIFGSAPVPRIRKKTRVGIANFIAQVACLGDEDLLKVQQLANKLLAMQATCITNRRQKGIKRLFPLVFKSLLSTL